MCHRGLFVPVFTLNSSSEPNEQPIDMYDLIWMKPYSVVIVTFESGFLQVQFSFLV